MARKAKAEIMGYKSVSNGALDLSKLPTRIKVMDWGKSEICYGGEVTLDEKSIEAFEANQKLSGRTEVALDCDHQTCKSAPAYKEFGSNPTIFAYGKPRIIKGDGLYLEDLQWTPKGQENAINFKDISPAPLVVNGRVVGLDSVALTPTGAINGLHFYSAFPSAEAMVKFLSAVDAIDEEEEEDEDEVNPLSAIATVKNPPAYAGDNNNDLRSYMNSEVQKFFSTLGLSATSSIDDVKAAFKKLLIDQPSQKKPDETASTAVNVPTAMSASDIAEIVNAAIKPFAAKIETFEVARKAEVSQTEEFERQAVLAQAAKEGKVLPFSADTVKTLPLAAIKEAIKNLKPEVPMSPLVKPFTAEGGNKKTRADSVAAFTADIQRARHDGN